MLTHSSRIKEVPDDDVNFLTAVIVVNCGGTINMGNSPRGSRPAGVVDEKLKTIQAHMEASGIGVHNWPIFDRPPDSSNIGEDEWRVILDNLKKINLKKQEIFDRLRSIGFLLEKGGIVVTHGTDTLQITALITALEFSVSPLAVPIVFTCSHSPMGTVGSDGLANLRKAIFVAKERFSVKDNLLPSVYVLIGQDVHLASRLTKVRTMPDSDGHYFFSFPAPVGRITGDRYHLRIEEAYLRRILPDRQICHLHDRPRRSFGIVEHLNLDKFSDPESLNDARSRAHYYLAEAGQVRERNRRIGFVIQGDFSANLAFSDLVEKISDLATIGPVCLGSKRSFDRLKGLAQGNNIALLPKSMTHAKAQAKLRWLLSFEIGNGEIQDLMSRNLAGEVFDTTELPEWINYETFPDNKPGTEIVIAYPNLHWRVVRDAIGRIRVSGKASSRKLWLYGFGDGHVPAVNLPLSEIVERYFRRELLLLGSPFLDEQDPIDKVEEKVAAHLANREVGELKDYLTMRYRIEEEFLRRAILAEIMQEVKLAEIGHLKKLIARLLVGIKKRGTIEIRMNNPEAILKKILDDMRFSVSEHQGGLLEGIGLGEWSIELVRALQTRFGRILARRLIKDAVMAADKLLNVIGEAVDERIEVRVRSLAVKSRTNTLNYEMGNLLLAVGVKSDDVAGWSTLYFLPR